MFVDKIKLDSVCGRAEQVSGGRDFHALLMLHFYHLND
jgi:hypothetical protein